MATVPEPYKTASGEAGEVTIIASASTEIVKVCVTGVAAA
jgi:hypothetical protein